MKDIYYSKYQKYKNKYLYEKSLHQDQYGGAKVAGTALQQAAKVAGTALQQAAKEAVKDVVKDVAKKTAEELAKKAAEELAKTKAHVKNKV
jgi:hypothetical protein